MEYINSAQPIFPVITNRNNYFGLTKREYFAALAMQGFASSEIEVNGVKEMAKSAVLFADTLLAELEK